MDETATEVVAESAGILEMFMSTDIQSALIGAGALLVAMLIKKFIPADKIPLIKNFVKKTDEELNK